ncbi:MAG: hypothetical protein ACRC6V_10980 [Bacteroidales bacterium]
MKQTQETKREAVELLIALCQELKVGYGQNEVIRITDFEKASEILEAISNSNLQLGTDLYNGYCSGKVEQIRRIGNKNISMYTADNGWYYEFTFRSLIILFPDAEDPYSPIIFIESDNKEIEECNEQYVVDDSTTGLQYLSKVYCMRGDEYLYGSAMIDKIRNSKDYSYKNYSYHREFLTKGLFCFINIQELDYNRNFRRFPYNNRFIDGKELEDKIRKKLKSEIF